MRVFALAAALALAPLTATSGRAETAVELGAYMVKAAGCTTCHTNGKDGGAPFAGGRPLKTPFGTYYSPNITPDEATGIGSWSDDDFLHAMKHGVSPAGDSYFPVFPYTTYTKLSDEDTLAIKAYLFSLPPVRSPNREHDVSPPFSWRWTMGIWKLLFFNQGDWQDRADKDAQWNRGGYLVEAASHCGECHTPRNVMGALKSDMAFAGTTDGPDGELVPNITPHSTGIGSWSQADIVALLRDGLKPNFDDVQGSMAEAIEDGLKDLSEEDLQAIAVYIMSVPPIDNVVKRAD